MKPLWTEGLHRFPDWIGLHYDLGGRMRANDPDDPLVGVMIAIDVENKEIRVEVSYVAFDGLLELLRIETADCHVSNDEPRVWVSSAQVLHR